MNPYMRLLWVLTFMTFAVLFTAAEAPFTGFLCLFAAVVIMPLTPKGP